MSQLLDEIKVVYNHVAIPPLGIKINSTYNIELIDDVYYVVINEENKLKMELEQLKNLFKPLNSTWEELLKKEPKKSVAYSSNILIVDSKLNENTIKTIDKNN